MAVLFSLTPRSERTTKVYPFLIAISTSLQTSFNALSKPVAPFLTEYKIGIFFVLSSGKFTSLILAYSSFVKIGELILILRQLSAVGFNKLPSGPIVVAT